MATAPSRVLVAELPNESELREYRGLAVVSVREGDKYRLALLRRGRLEQLPLPRSRGRFDADIGPDERGAPTIVYARRNRGIYRLRIGDAAPTRVATGLRPTLWRGRLAFVRSRRSRDDVLVLQRGRARKVGEAYDVEQLELRGSLLAIDSTADETNELHLVDLERGRTDLVARSTYGLSGTNFVGVSFTGHHLGWHRSCFGDSGGCPISGAYRYAYRRGSYEQLRDGYQPLAGFALLDGATLELNGQSELGERSEGAESDCAPTCPIQRATGLTWRRIRAARVK